MPLAEPTGSSSRKEEERTASLSAQIEKLAKKVGSIDRLAELSGIPRRTLANYISGASQPKLLAADRIARAGGVTLQFLITPEAAIISDSQAPSLARANCHISVRRYDVAVSAGSGAFPGEAALLEPVSFDKDFFSTRLRGRKPDAMIVVDARGDSMAPVIGDGDLVMIDTDDTTLLDAIYALSLNDELYVKRVVRHPDRIELLSDNPSYPPTTIPRSDIDDVKVIGRVVWIGHNLVGPA